MNDHRDAFERLAERGHHIGATALLDRLESAPADIDQPRSPVPLRRGLATAAAVFALVLAVGIALGIAFRQDPEVAEIPEVNLLLSDHDRGGPQGPIAAGPNGFVRPAGDRFEFSQDGRTWTAFDLTRSNGRKLRADLVGSHSVKATDSVWLLEALWLDRNQVWVSPDGLNWSPIEWEDPPEQVVTTGPGFVGLGRDDNDALEQRWSRDGIEWTTPGLPPGIDTDRRWFPVASRAGLVWIGFGDDGTVEVRATADGEGWAESRLDISHALGDGDLATPGSIEQIGGRWIFIVAMVAGNERTDHVWTSDNFVDWDYQGIPTYARDGDQTRTVGLAFNVDDLLITMPTLNSATDDRVSATDPRSWTGEIWATVDGATWIQVAEDLPQLQYFAGRQNSDGTYTLLYSP